MLLRHTVLYLPAQLLGPLFQFIAAVAWTHWLSADAYGLLTYTLASQELVYVACLAWWSQYTLRYASAHADDDARSRFQASENAILLFGLPIQAILTIAMLVALRAPLTPEMAAVAIVCCVSRTVTTHLCERARGAGRIVVYTVGQSLGPVLGFVVALALVEFVSATPTAALAGFALAQVAGLAWMWRELGLAARLPRPDAAIVRQALRFGLPLLGAGAISWISANGIRLVVEHGDGAEAVGLISVGWGLGQRLSSVVAMLVAAAAFPLAVRHLVDGSRSGAIRQISLGGAILYGLVAPAAVGIALIARPMVELIVSRDFQAVTIAILPLAALAGAARNVRLHFCDQVFMLFERTDVNTLVNAVEAVATVVCCWLGLRWGGLPGSVAGCLAGSVIGMLLGFVLAVTRFGLVLPWDHIARVSIATAAMTAALLTPAIRDIAAPPGARIAIDLCVGGLVYLIAMAALYPSAPAGIAARLRRLRPAD